MVQKREEVDDGDKDESNGNNEAHSSKIKDDEGSSRKKGDSSLSLCD